MRPWSPLRRTSGTSQPRNSAGRVNCGSSSRPRSPKLSVTGLTSLPITPGTQPGDGLDDQAGGDLAAGEHDVADAQLVVDEVLADAVVDALVAPAQQAEPVEPAASSCGERLVEAAAAGTEQEQRARRVGGLDGGEDRLGPHQHPGAAAERAVVDGAVDVGGVLARVVGAQVEQAGGAGLAEQARRAERVDDVGEDA